MLGIPLRGPIIPMGRIKISKKNPEKIALTCYKISDLYGNLQCFVLAGQFEGGGNPIARLHIPRESKTYENVGPIKKRGLGENLRVWILLV